MGRKLMLKDSSDADSRTCKENVTMEDVWEATNIHREDVREALKLFSDELLCRGDDHDFTKIDAFDEYANMVVNGVKDEEFLCSNWWNNHIRMERHHVTDYCHVDVDLFDILEMIADRVTAEKGRTGMINTNYLQIDEGTLLRAYWNTVKLLDDSTERE